jgi:hypothetical protein
MDYLHESAASIYRRRRRRRAVITLSIVSVLLLSTVLYAASYVQGWIGGSPPKAVASASCVAVTSKKAVTPKDVTINVYNATDRLGIAASVARSLQKQGFNVATIDNDPLGKTLLSPGEIRYGPSGAAGAALAAARLQGASGVQDARPDASVDFVLGNTYKRLTRKSQIAAAVKLASAKFKAHC